MKEFRYSRTEMMLFIDSGEVEETDGQDWVAPLELVADGSLASFRRAVLYEHGQWPQPDPDGAEDFPRMVNSVDYRSLTANLGNLQLSPASIDDFDIDYSPPLETSIAVMPDGSSVVDVQVEVHGLNLDEDDYAPLLEPLLDRLGAPLLECVLHGAGNQGLLVLRVAYGPRGATVGDAVDVGQSIAMIVSGMRDGALHPDAVLGMLAAGRSDLLIGVPESAWLDVKSQAYDLGSGDAAKIELAQDVARFANGEIDSLLLIGSKATKDPHTGEEAISKVTSALTPFNAQQYHQIIDNRVFPPVLGLTVNGYTVPLKGGRQGHLLAIRVPAQPEESKPFLVHGAIVDGKVEGAFISIVQRRGEHSIPITGPSVHATLAAGRALLRRGIVPPPP